MPAFNKALLVAACSSAVCSAHVFETSTSGDFGFGVHRLKSTENVEADCGNVTTNYYAQAIKDHFVAASKQEYWDAPGQRYFINDQYWDGPGAPIFVYIGGEGPESCRTLQPNVLLMSQMAQAHGALMVDIEHRYYGESYPTATDMTNEHLADYLTSEQALADLARLVSHIVEERGAEESKVLSFGGSYPGNLAAWFRLKYPHITDGSIASSAPLRAKTNFSEYMEVVTDSLTFWGTEACNNAVQTAVTQIVKYADQGPGSAGYAQLSKDFLTCDPLKTRNDVSTLFGDLMGNIQGTVQYNRESSLSPTVSDICATLTNSEGSAYENFVELSNNFTTLFFEKANGADSGAQPCEDASYDNSLAFLSNSTRDASNNARPWTYQTCNEFGYFQTADSEATPWFGMEAYLGTDYYLELCEAAFGGLANAPDTDNTNTMYGSDGIAASDVMFPNGSLDPWHALGVYGQTTLPQPSEVLNFINGTAHCADMSAIAPNTPPSPLLAGKQNVIDQVRSWLKQ